MAPLRRLPAPPPLPVSAPTNLAQAALVSRSYSGLLVDRGHHSGNDGAHDGRDDDNGDGSGGMTIVVVTMVG